MSSALDVKRLQRIATMRVASSNAAESPRAEGPTTRGPAAGFASPERLLEQYVSLRDGQGYASPGAGAACTLCPTHAVCVACSGGGGRGAAMTPESSDVSAVREARPAAGAARARSTSASPPLPRRPLLAREPAGEAAHDLEAAESELARMRHVYAPTQGRCCLPPMPGPPGSASLTVVLLQASYRIAAGGA